MGHEAKHSDQWAIFGWDSRFTMASRSSALGRWAGWARLWIVQCLRDLGRPQRRGLPVRMTAGLCLMSCIALGGCVPHIGTGPAASLGVLLDGSTAEVRYLCDEARVYELTVQRIDEVIAGGGVRGPILWSIESSRGVPVSSIELGTPPEGFEERVRLEEPPARDDWLIVRLRTDPDEDVINVDFRLSEIEPDEVAVFSEEMPRDEFLAQDFSC